MEKYILGMDIGGTNIRIGAVNENNEIICAEKVRQESVFTGENKIFSLIQYISTFLNKNNIAGKIDAISIGFPGTVDKNFSKIVQVPNIPGLDNVNIAAPLEKRFGVPVLAGKDVWTALHYDSMKFNIPNEQTTIGIYIGTGIGNAILMNGELLIGKNGSACELGHIPVVESMEPCGCGNCGCLENVAAGKYLVKLCKTEFQETEIGEIFVKHQDNEKIDEFIDAVSIAVATEINIFDPDYVLLGGGVLAMENFPKDKLCEYIHNHTRKPFPDKNLNLIFTEDDENKGIIGAALFARKILTKENRFEKEVQIRQVAM